MIERIIINFIPLSRMRYQGTWGDWRYENGHLLIDVAGDVPELPTESHRLLVGLHELVEAILCRKRGISQSMVDEFDIPFERDFDGVHYEGEPGDHPNAPYRNEHRKACLIEHLMANFLGMNDYGRIE